MKASDYDYPLPPELIAQEPAARRDQSRLMVLDRKTGRISPRFFRDLPAFLRPGDTVVLNDTKVRPVLLRGTKESGGQTEVLLVRRREEGPASSASGCPGNGTISTWDCLIRNPGRIRPGALLFFGEELHGEILERSGDGLWGLRLTGKTEPDETLNRIGFPPLPPYIRRRGREALREMDLDRYQTVYAREPGAIAAPTAGLHFTPEVLEEIRRRETRLAFLTLHVGVGTFLPVRTERVENHRLSPEAFVLPEATAALVNETKSAGGKVVAVGTTVVRTLESLGDETGRVRPGRGRTDLFILPGHVFRTVDALVTNFHLPRSTLLLLVSAFAGREKILAAYAEAIRERYRFYSYGDAMLIL
jgi:S-adenosylmethionine:tRNA ribosyltransferase-isomerase